MAGFGASGSIRVTGLLLFLTTLSPVSLEDLYDLDSSTSSQNCTTIDNFVSFHPTNASRLEEAKTPTQHRTSKDDQRHPENQLPDRYLADQRLNRHFDNDKDSNRKYEQNSNRNLEVYPLNRHLDDDEQLNRNFEDEDLKVHPLNRYLDDQQPKTNPESERSSQIDSENKRSRINFENERPSSRIDDQHLNRNLDDQNINRNVDDHLNKYLDNERVNLNKDRVSPNLKSLQYPSRRFEDSNPNRHLDGLHPDRRLTDEEFERRLVDQHPNYERHPIDQQPDNHRDSLQTNIRRPSEANFKRHPIDQQLDKHRDSFQPINRRISEPNFDRHPFDPESDKDLDNLPFNRHPSEPNFERYPIDQQFDKHSGSSEPINGHLSEPNFEKHLPDHEPDKTRDSLQPNRHLNQPNFERHLTDRESDKTRDDLQPNRRLNKPNFERHLTDHEPDKNRDTLQPDRHLNEPNFERHIVAQDPDKRFEDQQHATRRVDDSPTGRHFDDPNYERRLDEPSPGRHLDDLHPDRRINDGNFERRLVDHYPGGSRRFDDEVHSDRRLSDEDYDRHAIDQKLDRHNADQRPNSGELEVLHTDRRLEDKKIFDDDETTMTPRKESNISHLMTFNLPKEWDENKPKLNFPKKSGDERFKMATLHLDKGVFVFDFLRVFLSLIQPRNIPLDLLKDTLEGKVNVSTLITQSIRLEIVFIAVLSVFIVLMFVVPGTECWLCCRPHRYNYQRTRRGSQIFFLSTFTVIIGACVVTMLVCNEEVAGGIDRIPETMEAALQDLRDYHAGTAVQLRKCLTRSLDVASEAVLADLDNVEELLGKPIQAQLSSETGVDVALEALMDVANSSQELAYKTDGLLKGAERAREFGSELSREADDLRRELERTSRDCSPEDRSLCAVLDPTGLHLALRLDRVARDDRLLRLRSAGRENLTEAGRQSRGEYLYVPHHVSRTTLEARNQIRREINTARAKVSDEARSIEASSSDLSSQLDTARRLTGQLVPYVRAFEYRRWFVGFGTAMCVLLIWLLLFGALCCRCGSSEDRVRPTLLWFVFLSCLVSMALWLVLIAALTVASHAEMLLCRPLDDPEYRTVEAVLETKVFLGKRISVPLKDLFEKCEENGAAYPAFQLDNTLKLEQLTAHWTWAGLSRAFAKLKVDLTGLRILSPNLRERMQNLLYACGANLTEHRIMIQGPILNKDLSALSDQVENVARQLTDRRTARSFQTIAAQMRDLLSRRVKPLMKIQDELVYQLASLELHLQPLQRQVNQTLVQLRTVQYYIDSQGEKIGQLKTKAYVDRLGSFLDQWRAHVLTEMSSGVAKCRPLWDIMQGIKLLFCSHILGPLNGFWFATLVCVLTMIVSTPTAHSLATSYWRPPSSKAGSVLLPSRQGSPDTVVMERETWRSPNPPPSMDSW